MRLWPAPERPRASAHRLWTFHGGLHVPDEKALASASPIETLPIPPRLVIPLDQHIGAPARPCVRVGERVLKGQIVGEPTDPVSAALHASSSGTVVAIGPHPVAHPSGLPAPCILIETDGTDTWAPLPSPLDPARDLDPDTVRERIRAAGIVGLGGAAFPTEVKLSPGAARPIRTLILNGAECEPYIACDDRLMRERAERVVQGAAILARLLGPERVLIGVEDNKPEAIAAMTRALAEAEGLPPGATVVPIPTLYPSGGERQLIRILTGLEVPSGERPAQIGVLCQNVATAAAVADAVLWGRPLVSRIVTLSGRAIARPANLEVPIGTPAADLIAHCGGLRETPRKLLWGGPMMGFDLADTRAPVEKGTNALLALTAAESPDPGPALACIRCGRCAEVCPARLLPQQLYWYARAQDLDRTRDYRLLDCIECGCCAQVCPSHIPLVQYYRFAKDGIRAREAERRKAEEARARFLARQSRLECEERDRQERLRKKREDLEGGRAQGVAPAEDPRRAAIEAAKARAAAKRAARTAGQSTTADSTPEPASDPTPRSSEEPA